MHGRLLSLALFAAVSAHAAEPPQDAKRREAALARVVDRNVGHAHMTRGVNACTILALREAVTGRDLAALELMITSKDSVHRLAAGYVLSVMGDAGQAIVRANTKSLPAGDAEDMIQRAAETQASIDAYRTNGQCKRR